MNIAMYHGTDEQKLVAEGSKVVIDLLGDLLPRGRLNTKR